MGKRLIQQARGKGGPTYRSPGFRFKGQVSYPTGETEGKVIDILDCAAHTGPLVKVEYDNGESVLQIASEHLKIGDEIKAGKDADLVKGNIRPLRDIPEGMPVFNIEKVPGDGGKFIRSSGSFGRVVSQQKDAVVVELPSKRKKEFNLKCRATLGFIAASGRHEKPLLKAGRSYHIKRSRNKLWPRVSGNAQNAVDHPFGTSRSLRKAKAKPASKHAPPGRKAGMVGARRTGRKK